MIIYMNINLLNLGLFFLSVVIIILVLNFIFYGFVWPKLTILLKLIAMFLTTLQFALFVITSTSNPGIPTQDCQTFAQSAHDKSQLKYCIKCNLWSNKYDYNNKDNNVYHCTFCDICIEGN